MSAALAKAATVHRIPRNHHTPQPPPPGPVPDHPAPAVTAPPAPHTRTGQPAPPPNDPRPSWSTARRAATAAAVLFCAGFAFGAGTAIGNRLIHLTINAAPPPTHRKRQWPA
ncbi:hypothetical protein SSCG_06351 [Streptomyces clavuligerus]|nr:hypothetical protein SSCG_06351 [Streptomyces clavuligerus]